MKRIVTYLVAATSLFIAFSSTAQGATTITGVVANYPQSLTITGTNFGTEAQTSVTLGSVL